MSDEQPAIAILEICRQAAHASTAPARLELAAELVAFAFGTVSEDDWIALLERALQQIQDRYRAGAG